MRQHHRLTALAVLVLQAVFTGAATGKPSVFQIRQFRGHQDAVIAVNWSPDSAQILSGSWDNTARIWDVRSGKETRQFGREHPRVYDVGYGSVLSAAWSPNGRWIAYS